MFWTDLQVVNQHHVGQVRLRSEDPAPHIGFKHTVLVQWRCQARAVLRVDCVAISPNSTSEMALSRIATKER